MVLTSRRHDGGSRQRHPMLDLEYRHVDVFSRSAFHGNGLVVVLDAGGLSTTVAQELTREIRQFETAFVSDLQVASRTARLRVFTEDEELSFAGHPVLGSAAVLHSLLPEPAEEEAWTVELGRRRLTVLTRGHDGWVDASMDQGPAQFGPVVTGDLASRCRTALGLPAGSVPGGLPMQVVSTGLPYLIIPVHPEGLAAAAIQIPNLEPLLAESGAKFVYVLDLTSLEGRTWDNTGRIEDVATGSAAGPAAAYLIQHRIHPENLPVSIAQGRFAGRPSIMEVRREPANQHFWVGGPVAPVAAGQFHARLSSPVDKVHVS